MALLKNQKRQWRTVAQKRLTRTTVVRDRMTTVRL
jgi:hypothetical protein